MIEMFKLITGKYDIKCMPGLKLYSADVAVRVRNTGIPFTGIPVYRTILQYRNTGIVSAVIPGKRYQ